MPGRTGRESGCGSVVAIRSTRAASFLPYVYAPWLLPLFLPWAILPWTVAWVVWRGANVLLFLWSAEWAYRRHPLATAAAVVLLSPGLITTFDTGNVTLLLTLAVWLAQFSGPRLGERSGRSPPA